MAKSIFFSQMDDSKFPILESIPMRLTVATIIYNMTVLLKAPINLIFVTRNNANFLVSQTLSHVLFTFRKQMTVN